MDQQKAVGIGGGNYISQGEMNLKEFFEKGNVTENKRPKLLNEIKNALNM